LGGLGVFAKELIPAGTPIWRAGPSNTVLIPRPVYYHLTHSEVDLSLPSRRLYESIASYTLYYKSADALMLILDNGRFVNHDAEEPTSQFIESASIALKDILPGEEITENYDLYDQYPWPEPWDPSPGCIHPELVEEYLKTHPLNPCHPTHIQDLECYVGDAGPRGLGLFLGVNGLEGDVIWEINAETCLMLSEEQWRSFCASNYYESEASQWFYDSCMQFGFYVSSLDRIVVNMDNSRFVNHSLENTINGFGTKNILRYDSAAGTELLDDYSKYDRCPWAVFAWNEVLDPSSF